MEYFSRIIRRKRIKHTLLPILISILAVLLFDNRPLSSQPVTENQESIEVMVLGSPHFGNPGMDVINNEFPDVHTPEYQRQMEQVADSLAEFNPTKIAIEARPDYKPKADSMYAKYLSGRHSLTRNERQQLGFRMAKRFNHPDIYSIDIEGNFPFREVIEYAKKHDPEFIRQFEEIKNHVSESHDKLYQTATVREVLRTKNSPENLAVQRNYYALTAPVGDQSNYVGADLVSEWHKRNIRIFANLARIAEPGDRIIVIFGSGHSPLLRYFVESHAQMKLVEPNDYL